MTVGADPRFRTESHELRQPMTPPPAPRGRTQPGTGVATLPVNRLAIVAFVICWLPGLSIAALVLGVMAQTEIAHQVHGRRERGGGIALAAVVISVLFLLIYAFIAIKLIGDSGGSRFRD